MFTKKIKTPYELATEIEESLIYSISLGEAEGKVNKHSNIVFLNTQESTITIIVHSEDSITIVRNQERATIMKTISYRKFYELLSRIYKMKLKKETYEMILPEKKIKVESQFFVG